MSGEKIFSPRDVDGMSGYSCGGCGEGNLIDDPKGEGAHPIVCDLCGWTADAAVMTTRRRRDDAAPWTKRERKQRGELFFLWVQFDPDDLDAAFAVIRVLGLKSMHSSASSLIELDQKPSDQQLRLLSQIDGVREVRLAP